MSVSRRRAFPETPDSTNCNLRWQIKKTRKNLLPEFEEKKSKERIKVYLRVKPSHERDRQTKKTTKDFSNFVLQQTKVSLESVARNVVGVFSYSYVFSDSCSQEDVYTKTTQEMVARACSVHDSRDGLLFCYGVTNSGKTYTMQGSETEPGLIPLALKSIFDMVGNRLEPRLYFRPKYMKDAEKLGPLEAIRITVQKESLLAFSETEDVSSSSCCSSNFSNEFCSYTTSGNSADCETEASECPHLPLIHPSASSEETVSFSIWISFFEIYNEQIFDLLQPVNQGYPKRCPLKIGENRYGHVYLKDITHIPVNSANEALKVLSLGQKNLKFAVTKLNYNSSRSHCAFTIRVMKIDSSDGVKSLISVNRLAFFDLAGSERSSKTCSAGERLRESGNINTSLLSLGRCLRSILYNQKNGDNAVVVPFRDSKLTRMMQSYFADDSTVSMIVNISFEEDAFEENYRVLQFSSIARHVKVMQSTPMGFTQRALRFRKAPCDSESSCDDDTLRDDLSDIDTELGSISEDTTSEQFIKLIKYYKDKCEQYKVNRLQMEQDIRREVYAEYKALWEKSSARQIEITENMLLDTQIYADERLRAVLDDDDDMSDMETITSAVDSSNETDAGHVPKHKANKVNGEKIEVPTRENEQLPLSSFQSTSSSSSSSKFREVAKMLRKQVRNLKNDLDEYGEKFAALYAENLDLQNRLEAAMAGPCQMCQARIVKENKDANISEALELPDSGKPKVSELFKLLSKHQDQSPAADGGRFSRIVPPRFQALASTWPRKSSMPRFSCTKRLYSPKNPAYNESFSFRSVVPVNRAYRMRYQYVLNSLRRSSVYPHRRESRIQRTAKKLLRRSIAHVRRNLRRLSSHAALH